MAQRLYHKATKAFALSSPSPPPHIPTALVINYVNTSRKPFIFICGNSLALALELRLRCQNDEGTIYNQKKIALKMICIYNHEL